MQPDRRTLIAGFSRSNARNHYGVLTLTLEGGRFSTATLSAADQPACIGDYEVSGREITLNADAIAECGTAAGAEFLRAAWSFDDGELTLTDVRADRMIALLHGAHPWTLIG